MRSKCFISLLLSWQLSTILAQQTCYWPNGSSPTAKQFDLVNCYPSQAGICCSKGDMCMSNGLCFSGSIGRAYRGGCTEQNWNNVTACPLWCNDIHPNTPANIFSCTDQGWIYCNKSLASQCQSGGVGLEHYTSAKILGTPPIPSSESVATPSSCISTSSTVVTEPTTSITLTPSPTCTQIIHQSSKPATAIGVGLGVPSGIAATGFLVFLFRRGARRESLRGPKQNISGDERTRRRNVSTEGEFGGNNNAPIVGEMDGDGLQLELQGTMINAELHGNEMVQ